MDQGEKTDAAVAIMKAAIMINDINVFLSDVMMGASALAQNGKLSEAMNLVSSATGMGVRASQDLAAIARSLSPDPPAAPPPAENPDPGTLN